MLGNFFVKMIIFVQDSQKTNVNMYTLKDEKFLKSVDNKIRQDYNLFVNKK